MLVPLPGLPGGKDAVVSHLSFSEKNCQPSTPAVLEGILNAGHRLPSCSDERRLAFNIPQTASDGSGSFPTPISQFPTPLTTLGPATSHVPLEAQSRWNQPRVLLDPYSGEKDQALNSFANRGGDGKEEERVDEFAFPKFSQIPSHQTSNVSPSGNDLFATMDSIQASLNSWASGVMWGEGSASGSGSGCGTADGGGKDDLGKNMFVVSRVKSTTPGRILQRMAADEEIPESGIGVIDRKSRESIPFSVPNSLLPSASAAVDSGFSAVVSRVKPVPNRLPLGSSAVPLTPSSPIKGDIETLEVLPDWSNTGRWQGNEEDMAQFLRYDASSQDVFGVQDVVGAQDPSLQREGTENGTNEPEKWADRAVEAENAAKVALMAIVAVTGVRSGGEVKVAAAVTASSASKTDGKANKRKSPGKSREKRSESSTKATQLVTSPTRRAFLYPPLVAARTSESREPDPITPSGPVAGGIPRYSFFNPNGMASTGEPLQAALPTWQQQQQQGAFPYQYPYPPYSYPFYRPPPKNLAGPLLPYQTPGSGFPSQFPFQQPMPMPMPPPHLQPYGAPDFPVPVLDRIRPPCIATPLTLPVSPSRTELGNFMEGWEGGSARRKSASGELEESGDDSAAWRKRMRVDAEKARRERNMEAARKSRAKKNQKIEELEQALKDLEERHSKITIKAACLEAENGSLQEREKDLLSRIQGLEGMLSEMCTAAGVKLRKVKGEVALEKG
ncbi:hypothetical protein HDU97_009407 [Phlyctochytrium planicorne]|nr:hypothetical protein HDU97_009407 [Phlyctochytrium planicorne]